MNIHGIGTDIVNITRIKNALKRKTFLKKRIFSKKEIDLCKKKKNDTHACFAKKFAAKEAFSKALGTGISKGIKFKEIEIKNDNFGKPIINVYGNSLKVVHKIIKKKRFKTYLSISDDKPFAISTVIIITK